MYIVNQIIDDEILYIAVCDVCGLPYKEGEDENVTHSYHIHNACYWGLDMHAPGNTDTLETLGFKEYNDNKYILTCRSISRMLSIL